VNPKTLPYSRQSIDGADIAAVVKVLKGDWLTQGPAVAAFEKAVAGYCGARHAVAFSNGTAALHGAVCAAGLGPGDEAVTTPLSFAATANGVLYAGATPVFADVEKDGFNIDPAAVEKAWTRRTKALIPVDYAGVPASLDALRALVRRKGALVIEDASHALGARYKGKAVGSQSDMTTFSFHAVKPLCTGEGGMVLTNNADLYKRLMTFRTHGIVKSAARNAKKDEPWFYEMKELGFNYRLTDMQCALGMSQLKKADRFLARRRRIARAYDEAFKNKMFIQTIETPRDRQSAHHLYPLLIDFKALGKSRGRVMDELRRSGVGSQVHYIPIHLHPYYRKRFGYGPGAFPNAESFYAKELSIPLFAGMTDGDAKRVIAAVGAVISRSL
jgi:perosamine synthetase